MIILFNFSLLNNELKVNSDVASTMAAPYLMIHRFDKGWKNLHDIYKKLVDTWFLYDNSGESLQLIDKEKNQ